MVEESLQKAGAGHTLVWVKGHSGATGNMEADRMARKLRWIGAWWGGSIPPGKPSTPVASQLRSNSQSEERKNKGCWLYVLLGGNRRPNYQG